MADNCKKEEEKKVKIHPWWHPCVQNVINEIQLEKVMTTYKSTEISNRLLRNISGVSHSMRMCFSKTVLKCSDHSSMSNMGIINWLIVNYPGPPKEERYC